MSDHKKSKLHRDAIASNISKDAIASKIRYLSYGNQKTSILSIYNYANAGFYHGCVCLLLWK